MFCFVLSHQPEVSDYRNAQHDAVPAKWFEVMLSDVGEQELNDNQRDDECGNHAHCENDVFR